MTLSLLPIFVTLDPNKKITPLNIDNNQPVIANPVVEKPVPRKIVNRGAFSTPSILDALKDDPKSEKSDLIAQEDGVRYAANDAVKTFTEAELIEAWKNFVSTIDTPQLKSALSAREPGLSSQWKIDYELDTELQYNRLTLDLKPKLLGYLRRRFENEAIEIHFKVSEGTNIQSGIPYTDEERWNLLVTKYPALATLKSKFGLDFEHY